MMKSLLSTWLTLRIKDQHTLDTITKNAVHNLETTVEYYFFPSLVCVENPTDDHSSPLAMNVDGYIDVAKKTEQLTTRLLHVLIPCLAFACKPPDNPTEKSQ